MRAPTTIIALGALLLATSSLGCAKGEVLRTPDQWRDDIAAQMTPLTDDFRACYTKSKAGWAEHAKAMQGGKTVATDMKPKARETVIVSIEVDSAAAGESAKITAGQGYDDSVPKDELTSDGNLANCVRDVVKAKLKVPPKLDTNRGYGKWRVVFVPESPSAAPTVEPAKS